jgi:hypothetical protein
MNKSAFAVSASILARISKPFAISSSLTFMDRH